MKNRLPVIVGLSMGVLFIASLQSAVAVPSAADRLEIIEVQTPPVSADLPVVPWVQSNDNSWTKTPSSFKLDEGTNRIAEGWVAVSDRYIRLHVVVRDAKHLNEREGGNIWDGDGLQIGIDGRGDGAVDRAADSRYVGPDDASITVALTKRGPEIWAHFLGKFTSGYMSDGRRNYPCSIVRDETAKTTTYDVSFPWEDFSTCAGLSPVVGMCVQVNDSGSGPQKRYYWGRGADGEPRPGLFVRMAVGKPAGAYFAMIPSVNKLWRQNSPGEISIVAAGEGSLEILARLNGNEKILKPVLLTLKSGLHRFKVRGTPAVLSSETVALEAEIRTSDGKVLASQKAELTAPGIVIDKFQSRIEELVASSPDPLFTRHLRSLQALVMAEWNRGLFLLDTSPNVVESAARDCQTILKGLDEDGGRWQTYVRGERALVVAKSTSPDSVLQFYLLKLPKNWDPKKTYPLIVDLHGAGPSNPLFYIMANMEPRQTVSTQSGPDPQQYFRLMPWGRGNSGYMEFGETDVMDSLDDVLRRFKTDPDRTFLTGHSMGGGGAWAFALHNPDRWAAVCPVSGATWRIPKGLGLADNVAYVPFRIWHGDADSSVPVESAYLMQAELRRAGNEPEMVILPGQGHDYPWVAQVSNTIWLMKHVRKRPDHFSFIAETDRWRGAWGITMTRSLGVSALPRFDCSINGNTVRIRSEGTTGLSVQLGQGGLGLSGPVTLWWNGQKVYEGQPQEVPLGDYVSRR